MRHILDWLLTIAMRFQLLCFVRLVHRSLVARGVPLLQQTTGVSISTKLLGVEAHGYYLLQLHPELVMATMMAGNGARGEAPATAQGGGALHDLPGGTVNEQQQHQQRATRSAIRTPSCARTAAQFSAEWHMVLGSMPLETSGGGVEFPATSVAGRKRQSFESDSSAGCSEASPEGLLDSQGSSGAVAQTKALLQQVLELRIESEGSQRKRRRQSSLSTGRTCSGDRGQAAGPGSSGDLHRQLVAAMVGLVPWQKVLCARWLRSRLSGMLREAKASNANGKVRVGHGCAALCDPEGLMKRWGNYLALQAMVMLCLRQCCGLTAGRVMRHTVHVQEPCEIEETCR